ncbi:MAG TPA: class I adenylate-forming enzyme family protein [Chthoniobacterales bacterium]
MSDKRADVLTEIFSWATTNPGQFACVFRRKNGVTERLTYLELSRLSTRRALQIQSEVPGIKRVALLALHGPEFLIEALAIMAAGHCLVPVNPLLPPGDVADLLLRAGVGAIVRPGVDLEILPATDAIDGNGDQDFCALDPAYLRFTSGSTGKRKGVLLGHQTILDRTAIANERLQISSSDRVLCLLPMVDHLVVSILLYLRYGATVLLVEDPADALPLAAEERATVLYASPGQYRDFSAGDGELSDLRLAISTTQRLSETTAMNFKKRFQVPLSQALGMIEAGLLTLNDERAGSEPLLSGKPMPGYKITIADAAGNPLPNGEIGEVTVAGKGLLDAYVAPWIPRDKLLDANGFSTQDFGWIDGDGVLHLTGRGKNRLDLNGDHFFCEEVETVLNGNPAILESLVTVVNGKLEARIVRAGDTDIAELIGWAEKRLPWSRLPAAFRFVERLPLTPTGKVKRD